MERSRAVEVTLRVRPEVAEFAKLMEQKLAANDWKQHWRDIPSENGLTGQLSQLWKGLQTEVNELLGALVYGAPGPIAEEAADVANYAMMLADVAGGLGQELNAEEQGDSIQPEPADPFADVTDRYKLFCLAHGADSPEEMYTFSGKFGERNYLMWLSGWMREWKRRQDYNSDYLMTEDDHAEFDVWLEQQVLGGDEE